MESGEDRHDGNFRIRKHTTIHNPYKFSCCMALLLWKRRIFRLESFQLGCLNPVIQATDYMYQRLPPTSEMYHLKRLLAGQDWVTAPPATTTTMPRETSFLLHASPVIPTLS